MHNHGVIEIGDNLVIRSRRFNQVEISVGSAAQLQIGHKVFLNQGVRIACSTQIQIGNRCQIGDESVILDSDYHAIGDSTVKTLSVHLEDDVWLATRVIVLRGVTIGKGSVIGAGSVVTRSIPSCTFAAGVPARVLRSLPPR